MARHGVENEVICRLVVKERTLQILLRVHIYVSSKLVQNIFVLQVHHSVYVGPE